MPRTEAVEWTNREGALQEGVFIPRRETGSLLTRLGGKAMHTAHHAARFSVQDADQLSITARADDGHVLQVRGRAAPALPADSGFRDLPEASEFFRRGSVGHSPGPKGTLGVKLLTESWQVQPFEVAAAGSTFLERELGIGPDTLPDNALLMRNIPHRWQTVPGIRPPREPSGDPSRKGPARPPPAPLS